MNKRSIEVVTFQPEWEVAFHNEKVLLEKVLNMNNISNIHHIGSTSVKGLAAKPIIDILVEVKLINAVNTDIIALSKIGYRSKGENGITGRHYFQKGGNNRSHHLHIFELGHPVINEHLAFRNYLSSHLGAKMEYAKIKQQAAKECNHDAKIYMAMKNTFIAEHMKKALKLFPLYRN